jgi:hypothetical protein
LGLVSSGEVSSVFFMSKGRNWLSGSWNAWSVRSPPLDFSEEDTYQTHIKGNLRGEESRAIFSYAPCSAAAPLDLCPPRWYGTPSQFASKFAPPSGGDHYKHKKGKRSVPLQHGRTRRCAVKSSPLFVAQAGGACSHHKVPFRHAHASFFRRRSLVSF